MVKHFFRHKTIAARLLALTAVALLLTACNWLDLGGETATPAPPDIFAPANNTTVLLGAPVQIQSGRFGSDVSRVELWVRKPNAATDELLRSDIPEGGNLLQEWKPTEVGPHTITLRSFTGNNPSIQLARTYEVIPDAFVSLAPPAALPAPAQSSSQAQPTAVPPTPLAVPPGQAANQAASELQTTSNDAVIVQVVATSTPVPTATPIPRYPPPPPIPGVPPGPLQSPLLNVSPPVCDAAEYLGPYASDTSRRVVITEDDDIAAKVVGGTTVFRAWRLQNVGTCTWGPGYELTFYGGRSMGSGGVAFESTFPGEPPRRNTLIDANRLIVPEGKPNQVAVVEVQLVAPVTPGIHQSYWRMRNPHGVFFGPIIGVTMEVVRDCAFGIYGAPVINRFEILGVGNVYRPANPISVKAEVGQNVTLDYSIINATNFDIVFEEPSGGTQTVSTQDQNGRFSFPAKTLGRNVITLYADNGSCSIPATVYVDVVPRAGSEFELDIILASGAPVAATDANASFSSAVLPGTIQAEWQHYDSQVNQILFNADLYKRERVTKCLIEGWLCGETSGDWKLVQRVSPGEISDEPAGAATVCRASERCSRLPTEIIGAQAGAAQAEARISEAEHLSSIFCPANAGSDPNVEYGVSYYLEAGKDGQPADPARSNQVFVLCGQTAEASDFRPAVSEPPSCTLTELGGITLPLACNDVPIAAGVMVVLLMVVLWVFFK
ncbi:MAG: hypothetical protein BroJett011_20660 [Chloroflexota bacterium]|nr:MAG: hypothetical protein BroJett011_20660 [Chloroflexota bacterium]